MKDIHTHILPGMDDGARDVTESLALLALLKEQGITQVVLTPHFYSDQEQLACFLSRRQTSYAVLRGALGATDMGETMELILGSETYLSDILFSYDSLDSLCMGETNQLLLELPYTDKWGPAVFKKVDQLISKYGIVPIIAHVERYEATRRHPEKIFQELVDLGCLLQFNTQSVTGRLTRHATMKLIRRGWADFIASDCHNMEKRPPEFTKFNVISRL